MEDKRLEQRKKFLDPVKDGRQDREKYMVNLRKKRKQDIFKNKRMKRMQEDSKNEAGESIEGADGYDGSMGKGGMMAPSVKYAQILKTLVPSIYEENV